MSIVIKFRKMDNTAVVDVPLDDLAAHMIGDAVPDTLSVLDKQEEEMPSEISITYPDFNYDYNQATQLSKTITGTVGQLNNIPIPVAMDAQQARALADLIKFEIFSKRLRAIKFYLQNDYAEYEPTDVINLPLGSKLIPVRITKKDQVGGLIEFEGEQHYAFVYGQEGIAGGAPLGYQGEVIAIVAPTMVYFLDTPILRDIDNDVGLYVAMGGMFNDWNGASLYQSIDGGVTYFTVASTTVSATHGVVLNAVGDFNSGNFYDCVNYMDVLLTEGELFNTTLLSFLDGTNSCVIGKPGRYEIASFKNAELIGDNQYRLTFLLRGRRGTEQHIGTHQAGDHFVLINTSSLSRILKSDNKINFNLNYKAPSFGESFNSASLLNNVNQGNGLKPYSPVHGHYGLDATGNRLITWKRRTRINGGWFDSADAPLGETSLLFSIDFIDIADAVVRTVNDIAEEQYLYEDYAADFPSGNGRAVIYQLSETVGRGFPHEIELD